MAAGWVAGAPAAAAAMTVHSSTVASIMTRREDHSGALAKARGHAELGKSLFHYHATVACILASYYKQHNIPFPSSVKK